jgi:MFS family permease
MLAGGATLVVALLLRATVREPARSADAAPPPVRSMAQVGDTLGLMWQDRALRQTCIGAMLTAVTGYGALAWLPSYLVRSHHLDLATIGLYLAAVIGIGGAIGSWLGGFCSDKLRRHDIRWSLWLVAFVFIGSKPFSMAFYALDNTALALTLFVVPAAVGAVFVGPSIAVLHNRVPPHMRPIASAIFLLGINFIGLGLGPLLAGALSQFMFGGAGEDSLRYAMIVMQVIGVWGGVHYYLAGRRLGGSPA